jgi:N-acetylneuraminic acid mutarotase
MASMPTARTGLAGDVVGGRLYAIGGYSSVPPHNVIGKVEAYDPATNAWSTKSPMPTRRGYLAVGVVNRTLYAVGGINHGGHIINTVEAFPR